MTENTTEMGDTRAEKPSRPLSQLWQFPLLIFSVVLLVVGWSMTMTDEPEIDIVAKTLETAQALVLAGRYEDALVQLDQLKPEFKKKTFKKEAQAKWYQLRGDAVYLGYRSKGWTRPLGGAEVIKCYNFAEQLDLPLDGDSVRLPRLAESLLDVGEYDQVRKMLGRFGAEGDPARQKWQRRLVELAIKRGAGSDEELRVIGNYLIQKKLPRADKLWAVARKAELMMGIGDDDGAAKFLSRYLFKMGNRKPDVGELHLLLGKCSLALGEMDAAEREFTVAQELLKESNPLSGQVLVGLGRILQARDNHGEAAALFQKAVEHYPATDAHLPALVGLAESESRLRDFDASLNHYAQSVDILVGRGDRSSMNWRRLAGSLAGQRELRRTEEDFPIVLSLLELEKKLYGRDYPPDLTLRLAATRERMARKVLGIKAGRTYEELDWRLLGEDIRKEAGREYAMAGEYYSRHADQVAADKSNEYADSLWKAADCYNNAGLYPRAAKLYGRFVTDQPNDPRQLAALFNMAQAYQADGLYNDAISLYQKLRDEHPKATETYSSLVPLAQCYLAKGVKHWSDAELVLRSVITDHPALRPESKEYRQALVELGQLYYGRGDEGDYEQAIVYLKEATDRYNDHPDFAKMLFQLGDAYRKSVDQIDQQLAGPMQPSQKIALRASRADRLDEAQVCFDRVIDAYEQVNERKLSALEKLYLRNSYFYRADCAYDLGRFEGVDGAIGLYEKAVSRYEKDPAALVAMVQIVNSYCELKKYDQARVENNRAKKYLEQIPDEAFEDPNLPMSREHWQRWLDWSSELDVTGRSAAVGSGSGS